MKYSCAFGLIMLFLISCNSSEEQWQNIIAENPNDYTGITTCLTCHSEEHSFWRGSHHDWAMKMANDSTVIGNFDNAEYFEDGVFYLFYRKNSDFRVKVKEAHTDTTDHLISFAFGIHPLQQYLIEFPKGQFQTLRASWDVFEKKWFHQYADTVIPEDDWLHWSNGGQRWNTMCAECHSTDLHRNYNPSEGSFNSTYEAINVSCESCHGPGRHHVLWAENYKNEDSTYVLNTGRTQNAQVNMCAGCHARRVKLTEVMNSYTPFDNQFRLQTLNTAFYFADGQIKEEDYVFGSFVQSKMFHEDVKCTDCHNAHSGALTIEGNGLCLQCHEPVYNSKDHHFHEENTAAALCVSCHMTGRNYMGNDFRRDHSFRVPRPDQSAKYGTPNACIECHTTQEDQWAADAVEDWYGKDRQDHFSDYLIRYAHDVITPKMKSEMLSFVGDTSYPGIARATALEYLPADGGREEYQTLVRTSSDKNSLVRAHTYIKLSQYTDNQRVALALKGVEDEVRMVRVAAANLLVGVPELELAGANKEMLKLSRKEHYEMLVANLDFPSGRLQFGDYFTRKGQFALAIEQYKWGIMEDKRLIPAYSNLATAYNNLSQNDSALVVLNRWIDLEPSSRGYYLRALLLFEMERKADAIDDLNRSIKYDPKNVRAYYNLTTIFIQDRNIQKAKEIVTRGLKELPDNEDLKSLQPYLNEI
ncbi:MAG TPA: hypothetical protein DDX92_05985 [Flavobacteriales bacterium]|jgi:predicted CXXCH cytochrome family protein|nr:hypothetical protein [Flavobacteriales bacterium]